MSSGTGFNGCYASHIIIRKGTHVIKMPNEINDNLGATINCALATMVNTVDQIPTRVKRSLNKVLIQGDGMLGLYGCVLLKELGFKHVYCSGNHPGRDKLVSRLGAIPLSIGTIEANFATLYKNITLRMIRFMSASYHHPVFFDI